jgi:hypothetical protein
MNSIDKPRKTVVPIAVGLAWGSDSASIFQEKMDGQFDLYLLDDDGTNKETILAGEKMRDGTFWVFDCLCLNGVDIRQKPLSERLTHLGGIFTNSRHLLPDSFNLLPFRADATGFLAEVLARGGEGVVKKSLDAPWGTPMEAAKRSENFYCIVTAMGNSQSVEIADAATGQPRGKVKLGGGKCDRVRVGSILKLNGFGLHASGLIREPVIDRDSDSSWLSQF